MKMALFYTMLKIRADYSKQATKVLQEKLCGAMTLSASRDQSFMSNNSMLAEGLATVQLHLLSLSWEALLIDHGAVCTYKS